MGTTAVAIAVELLEASAGTWRDGADLRRAVASFLGQIGLDAVPGSAVVDSNRVVRVAITGPGVPDAPFCEIVVTVEQRSDDVPPMRSVSLHPIDVG
jgi:hypothetical protein